MKIGDIFYNPQKVYLELSVYCGRDFYKNIIDEEILLYDKPTPMFLDRKPKRWKEFISGHYWYTVKWNNSRKEIIGNWFELEENIKNILKSNDFSGKRFIIEVLKNKIVIK